MDIINTLLQPIFNLYKTKHYKWLLLVPLLLGIISIYFIPFIPQGVDLKGGILVSLQTKETPDVNTLKSSLAEFGQVEVKLSSTALNKGLEVEIPLNDDLAVAETALKDLHNIFPNYTSTRLTIDWLSNQLNITADAAEKESLRKEMESNETLLAEFLAMVKGNASIVETNAAPFTTLRITSEEPKDIITQTDNLFSSAKENFRSKILSVISSQVKIDTYSFKEVGPALSTFFLNRTKDVIIYAVLFTAIAVFIVFRKIVPTIVILASTLFNLVIALGAMGMFQVPLTLASIATLLLLIGLSLDTTIMLGVKVFKKKEDLFNSIVSSELTSYTMLVGLLISFITLLIMGILTDIPTYFEISFVALAGVFADAVNDLMLCDVIILWYAEREKKK